MAIIVELSGASTDPSDESASSSGTLGGACRTAVIRLPRRPDWFCRTASTKRCDRPALEEVEFAACDRAFDIDRVPEQPFEPQRERDHLLDLSVVEA